MKQIKIISFDWEYYQVNKDKCRVITSHKESLEVSQLTKFETEKEDFCLIGVCNDNIESWTLSGNFTGTKYNPNDLRLELTEEVVESWVNVYEFEDGHRYAGSGCFSSKEQAINDGKMAKDYITTIALHELKSDES